MKRILVLFLLCSSYCFSQYTPTPNIGLQIPANGSTNWNLPLNYNFNRLDLLLSGNANLPGLSISGNEVVTGSITAGSFVGVGGGSFPTISGSPSIGQCTYWVTSSTIGSQPCNSGVSGVSSFNTRTGPITLLVGDVNSLGTLSNNTTGNAATSTSSSQLNGSAIPISAPLLGTNSSGQLITAGGVTPYCAGVACSNQYNTNFTSTSLLYPSVAVGLSDTTIYVTSTAGWPSVGCAGFADSGTESWCWTGITSGSFTGVTRAMFGSTAMTHVATSMSTFGGYLISYSSSTTASPSYVLFNNGWIEYSGRAPFAPLRFDSSAFFANGLNSPYQPIYAGRVQVGPGSSTPNQYIALDIGADLVVQNAAGTQTAGITNAGAASFTSLTVGGQNTCLSNGGNCANIPYAALVGTVPTWNQNTTGNAYSANSAVTASTAAIATTANAISSSSHVTQTVSVAAGVAPGTCQIQTTALGATTSAVITGSLQQQPTNAYNIYFYGGTTPGIVVCPIITTTVSETLTFNLLAL